jgi:hypothetical protein
VFHNPDCVNLKTFHLLFKERVLDIFKQSWCNQIALSGSLFLYKEFKRSVDFEMYLDILPSKFRTVLSRLRLSSHQLNIEVGRQAEILWIETSVCVYYVIKMT